MSGTFTNASAKALSLAELDRVVREIAALPPEPIGEWMRGQGFPPEKGGLLVLPEALAAGLKPGPPFGWPAYVFVSKNALAPMLMWDLFRELR